MENKKIEAEFNVLDDRGPQATLECPRCGCEFDVDAYTNKNLILNREKKFFVAICPLCATQQE